jgi:hypothetical protein
VLLPESIALRHQIAVLERLEALHWSASPRTAGYRQLTQTTTNYPGLYFWEGQADQGEGKIRQWRGRLHRKTLGAVQAALCQPVLGRAA